MRRVGGVTAIYLLLLACVSLAQSVDGKWTTALHARGSNGQIITLTLKTEGSKVTGTLYGKQPIPLEGTIEGHTLKITLKVTSARGNTLSVNYTAILDGEALKLSYQSPNGRPPVFGEAATEFTATRVQ